MQVIVLLVIAPFMVALLSLVLSDGGSNGSSCSDGLKVTVIVGAMVWWAAIFAFTVTILESMFPISVLIFDRLRSFSAPLAVFDH